MNFNLICLDKCKEWYNLFEYFNWTSRIYIKLMYVFNRNHYEYANGFCRKLFCRKLYFIMNSYCAINVVCNKKI